MSASLTPSPVMQFFDNAGNPLSGGKLYTYQAGTSTPLATYTDQGGATPNANPVVLNTRGEANIWLGTSLYKFTLKDSTDALIWTSDNIGGVATVPALAASSGSSMIGFIQAGTGAVARTEQSKLRDFVSVKDFGAVADGSTSDTTAIQAAITSLSATGGTVFFPLGDYASTATITIPDEIILQGCGNQGTRILHSGAGVCLQFGNNPSAVKRGLGCRDMGILMSQKTATAISTKGIVGGVFENIYIEGSIETGRTDVGVVIDSGNASTFFNTFKNIDINHIQNGFKIVTTGSANGTDNTFINCSVFGDRTTVGAASVGVSCGAFQGNGSVWLGGNLENCGTGFLALTGANNFAVMSCRFENNTIDSQKNSLSYPWQFINCTNLTTIVNNGGSGYDSDTYVGCTDASGFPIGNKFFGGFRSVSQSIANIPGYFSGMAGQTGDLILADNAIGAQQFAVTPNGTVFCGAGAIGTTEPNGMLCVTTCAGAPTSSPTLTPWAPLLVDTTNNRLYFYSSGSWRNAGP